MKSVIWSFCLLVSIRCVLPGDAVAQPIPACPLEKLATGEGYHVYYVFYCLDCSDGILEHELDKTTPQFCPDGDCFDVSYIKGHEKDSRKPPKIHDDLAKKGAKNKKKYKDEPVLTSGITQKLRSDVAKIKLKDKTGADFTVFARLTLARFSSNQTGQVFPFTFAYEVDETGATPAEMANWKDYVGTTVDVHACTVKDKLGVEYRILLHKDGKPLK